jgi:hypothetical protein
MTGTRVKKSENLHRATARDRGLGNLPGFVHANDLLGIYLRIFAPICLLTLVPMPALRDGEYAIFLVSVSIDVVFLSIMIFSIVRNHKIVGAVSPFVFNFLCVAFIASGI